ncbi:MAG: TIGR00266 family protein, partial [Planctomycetes bacterium]|nr:TIGR00266 family protein [Planctomycetota bacterium]
MSTIQITCDNCGAKYKLPESFSSPKAKCQKCGSVIDVASQRDVAEEAPTAAAAAAAAKPAAAA